MIRFSKVFPCPVCSGFPELERGRGVRCAGFIGDDPSWARCERPEYAGDLRLDERTTPPTYAHKLEGACRCGAEHGVGVTAPRARTALPPRRIVATYDYQDASGRVLYRVARLDPKGFLPQHINGAGTWESGYASDERVLYRLPALIAAPGRVAFVTEGERDADRLASLGLLATTNAGGSASWKKHATAYSEAFRGRARAVVLVDNDAPGRKWAGEVAASLAGVGCPVVVIELPDLPVGGDVSDWLDAGHTTDELKARAASAQRWTPPVHESALSSSDEPTTVEAVVGSGEREDTAALLDDVQAFLRRFLVLPGAHFYDAMALFVLHAHAIGAADTSPRLILKSPEKESGKTRALEVLELLVPAPLAVMNTTTAAIFRLLAEEQATVLFDEVDAVFASKVGNYEDLRALLNAGYRRGATVARVVGEGKKMRTERFPVFAARALAAIGDLPDTIESRAIIVPMRRRAPGEEVEPFRRRRVVQEVAGVRDRLVSWALTFTASLTTADPVMPEQLEDRAADIWEPLLAIADLAGEEWAKRGRDAAISVVKGRVAEDASVGVRLLSDIKVVMGDHDRISSAALCAALNALAESGWAGWNDGKGINQRDLAKRLKGYGIGSKVLRLPDDTTPRGYMSADLSDAFARYLRAATPIGSATSATSATPIRIQVADVADVALGIGAVEIDEVSGGRVF